MSIAVKKIEELATFIEKTIDINYAKLLTTKVTESNLLIDLPRKYIELLASPSKHFPSLTKHAVHIILKHRLRSDSFFDCRLSEVETFDSLAWYLFKFKDDTCLYKSIIKSSTTNTLSDFTNYDYNYYIPPIFSIWARKVGLFKRTPKKYRELYRLYHQNQDTFSECCADFYIEPSLYYSLPSDRRNLDHRTSRNFTGLVSKWGLKKFPQLLKTSVKNTLSEGIEFTIAHCFFDLAVHSPLLTHYYDKFGHNALKWIRELNISSSLEANEELPLFPVYCYLLSIHCGAAESISNEFWNRYTPISRERLAKWFFGSWITRFPSSLALCSEDFKKLGENLNITKDIQSDHLHRTSQIETNGERNHQQPNVVDTNQKSIKLKSRSLFSHTVHSDLRQVAIVGHWNTPSGLTQNAHMSYRTLEKAGSKVIKYDINQTRNFCRLKNKQTCIVHVNADESPIAILKAKCKFSNWSASLVAGFYLWETEEIPPIHELGVDLADKLITPTEFVANAYKIYDANSRPLVVGKAIKIPSVTNDSKESDLISRLHKWTNQRFIFFTSFDSGSGVERKNPLSLVRAYIAEFNEYQSNTVLIIKAGKRYENHWGDPFESYTKILKICQTREDIKIIDYYLPDDDLNRLMIDSSCIVSSHRAEGFGYLLAYALLLGKPLISTNYSGLKIPKSYPKYYPVDYSLIATPNGKFFQESFSQKWAQPSHTSLRKQLRLCYEESLKEQQEINNAEFIEYCSDSEYYTRLLKALVEN